MHLWHTYVRPVNGNNWKSNDIYSSYGHPTQMIYDLPFSPARHASDRYYDVKRNYDQGRIKIKCQTSKASSHIPQKSRLKPDANLEPSLSATWHKLAKRYTISLRKMTENRVMIKAVSRLKPNVPSGFAPMRSFMRMTKFETISNKNTNLSEKSKSRNRKHLLLGWLR